MCPRPHSLAPSEAAGRQFAEDWDGTGIDARWVGRCRTSLRVALRAVPVYGAALPLQAAWLATQQV